jgi:hypothetical protein
MVSHSLCRGATMESDLTHGDASPGYFSLTLDNSIRMEATSTRRAGLERFTFPKGNTPFFTLDLSNDLPHSFRGGNMTIDPKAGRITIGGIWGSRFATRKIPLLSFVTDDDDTGSFGPGSSTYQAFACYDLNNGGQNLSQFGIWTADSSVSVVLLLPICELNFGNIGTAMSR